MTMTSFVIATGKAMIVSYAVLLVLLALGVVSGVRRRDRSLTTDAAARDVLAALTDYEAAPDERTSRNVVEHVRALLEPLRGVEKWMALMLVAAAVGGQSLVMLRGVAADLGLVEQAERSLRARSWVRRLLAARFLTAVSHRSARVLDLARDPHPAVRAQAALWVAVNDEPPHVEALGDLLADADPRCRFNAKDSLARVGTRATDLVTRLLSSPDPVRRRGALEIAGAVGDAAYLPALRDIATTGQSRQQALATTALGATGDPAATELLGELLANDDVTVRCRAVAALAGMADWRNAAVILPLLDDESRTVRREAGLALLRLGAPGLVLLREAAARSGPEASVAAQILGYHEFTGGRT
jgi:HEAT repeat protein